MKFGGSSLANLDRLDHVATLIKTQIKQAGVRPRAIVCSAMGKTTNSLLCAGNFALGRFRISFRANGEHVHSSYLMPSRHIFINLSGQVHANDFRLRRI